MTRWTTEQTKAITDRDNSIIVSAGAGSGKTAVLIERIISLILEKRAEADEILVATFTRAAAQEMKQRVRKALYEKAKTESDKDYIYEQITKLESAQISTLHSFCYLLIRKYYHVIDLDPATALISEDQNDLLQLEALEMLFEEKYAENDANFIDFVDYFSTQNDDSSVKEMVRDVHHFIMNKVSPFDWLEIECAKYEVNENEYRQSLEFKLATRHLYNEVNKALNVFRYGVDLFASDTIKREEYFRLNIKNLEDMLTLYSTDKDAFVSAVGAFTLGRFTGERVEYKNEEEIKFAQKLAKGILDDAKKMLCSDLSLYHSYMSALSKHIKVLCESVKRYSEIISALKLEKKAIDFNDIEHYAIKMLENEKVSNEVQRTFKYVFVDEYQDTNSIQEKIIMSVSKKDNLFVVGDIKQSIYKFRLAEPKIFMERYKKYKQSTDNEKLIHLNANFRSSQKIIAFINRVFTDIMFEQTGGVDYEPDEVIIPSNTSLMEYVPELHLIVRPSSDSSEDANKHEREAMYVANLIKELLHKDIYDEELKTMRKVRPSDIAILGRSMKKNSAYYIEQLKKIEVESICEEQVDYYDEMEIELIVNMLKVIDNDKNDIALGAVLRSFLYNFDVDELLRVRLHSPKASYFHEAFLSYSTEGEDEKLREKILFFYEEIRYFREQSRHISLEKLLRLIYDKKYVMSFVGALPLGESRQFNLNYLITLGANFEKSTFKGLYSFILLIEKAKQNQKMKVMNKAVENADAVKIMTIHKSKGLGFNVVILTGCANQFNMLDIRNDYLLTNELGISMVYRNKESLWHCDSLSKTVANRLQTEENLAEEMRLLYVAMTRAKQLLYMTALVKDTSGVDNTIKESRIIKKDTIMNSNNFLDFLICSLSEEAVDISKIAEINEFVSVVIAKDRQTYLEELTETEEDTISDASAEVATEENSSSKKSANEFDFEKLFSYTYPYEKSLKVPAKVSVSAIMESEMLEVGERVIPINDAPSFITKSSVITGARIGSITHLLLERLDFNSLEDGKEKQSCENILSEMLASEEISEEERKKVPIKKIVSFLTSSFMKEVISLGTIHKERPFLLKIKASQIGYDCDEDVFVQGVIDCYCETSEGIILIDYKTNHYKDEESYKKLIEKYTTQLKLYELALAEATKKKIIKSYLCFINMEKFIEI